MWLGALSHNLFGTYSKLVSGDHLALALAFFLEFLSSPAFYLSDISSDIQSSNLSGSHLDVLYLGSGLVQQSLDPDMVCPQWRVQV